MAKTIYFKGLNGIRAIAALIVVVWHTDQFSYLFHLLPKKIYLSGMAARAVDIFFVLSGFLITYLLLLEKDKHGKINFKKFYLRRIYRIWPLYYLIVILSLILIYFKVIPTSENPIYTVFFNVFIMANIAYVLKIQFPAITPLWSLGVEEQFYLIWPYFISKTKKYLKVFIVFYFFILLLRITSFYVLREKYPIWVSFLYDFRVNIMAFGAIGAYLVYSKHKVLNYIYRKDVQLISWLVLLYSCLIKPIHIRTFIDSEINSIFYLIIILNVATNSKSIFSLENKFFNFIGKISYGIYMYHLLVIYCVAYTCEKINISLDYYSLMFIVISLTIAISYLSYLYYESIFLKMKYKYMVVESSNSQKKDE